MNIKEMRFSLGDFALVTQKRVLKDYNVSVGQFFGLKEDSPIPCGAVYELALINPQSTKFVLVRDLEKGGPVQNFKGNAVGFRIGGLKMPKELTELLAKHFSEEDKRLGVEFHSLATENSVMISHQLHHYNNERQMQPLYEKKQKLIAKSRKEYLEIFEK